VKTKKIEDKIKLVKTKTKRLKKEFNDTRNGGLSMAAVAIALPGICIKYKKIKAKYQNEKSCPSGSSDCNEGSRWEEIKGEFFKEELKNG